MKLVGLVALAASGCDFNVAGNADDPRPDAARPIDAAPDPDAPSADAGQAVSDAGPCAEPPLPFVPSNLRECIAAPAPALVLDQNGSYQLSTDSAVLSSPDGTSLDLASRVVDQSGGPAILVISVARFAIDPQARLIVSGSRALAIVSFGDIVVEGSVRAGGSGAASGPGANDPTACASGLGATGSVQVDGNGNSGGSGGGGGGYGGDGGRGAPVAGSTGGQTAGGSASGGPEIAPLVGGCRGGAGGNAGGGAGGGGGGAIQLVAAGQILIDGTVAARGGGGRGVSGAHSGGGGGGSGGAILLEASAIVVQGALTANGGGGGEGGRAAGSSDSGNDGSESTSGQASGGAFGSFGGNGGDGGSASGSAEDGQVGTPSGSNAAGGGGGGGSVGRIRLRAPSIALEGAVISPP